MFHNFLASHATRRMISHVGLGHSLRPQLGFLITRKCSSIPTTTSIPQKKIDTNISTRHKITEKVKEEWHRLKHGSILLGKNTKTAATLMKGVAQGRTLSRRERILLTLTVSDLMRMVPFIAILLIPFAEFALPVLLKLFPNMLPSTFTSASQKENARTRKLQAKLKLIELMQAASNNISLRRKLDSLQGAQESLVSFMSKVSRSEDIKPEEVIKISQLFHNEFALESLERQQLVPLVKFFGIPSIGTSFILQESLKFKWNSIKRDDAHILQDGIDTLTPAELEEAALVRGFSHTNCHQSRRQYLQDWITLSQENVPPYLLLLSRGSYLIKKSQQVVDVSPPVIAPFVVPAPELKAISSTAAAPSDLPREQPEGASSSNAKRVTDEASVDVPEKEIMSLQFRNLSHELSHDPVASKIWDRVARFTSELKKDTFGGREDEVIHLGDASGEKLSTVITAELRQYLQALFIALDKDSDRKLSVDEVEHGLNASDIPVKRDEAVALVKKFDTDNDNHLHFDEFVDCLLYLRKNRE